MSSLFKRKDPICGMKEGKGQGIISNGVWFCSDSCLKQYKTKSKNSVHKLGHGCRH